MRTDARKLSRAAEAHAGSDRRGRLLSRSGRRRCRRRRPCSWKGCERSWPSSARRGSSLGTTIAACGPPPLLCVCPPAGSPGQPVRDMPMPCMHRPTVSAMHSMQVIATLRAEAEVQRQKAELQQRELDSARSALQQARGALRFHGHAYICRALQCLLLPTLKAAWGAAGSLADCGQPAPHAVGGVAQHGAQQPGGPERGASGGAGSSQQGQSPPGGGGGAQRSGGGAAAGGAG